MTSLLQDLQFAFRQLRRAPGFAITAILTLALAIGVSTAVFSVLDATLVRPLPYKDPGRIVAVRVKGQQFDAQPASWPQYLDWRRGTTAFTALAGWGGNAANLETGTSSIPVHTVETTDNFFDVFAVPALLGRTFLPGETLAGCNDLAVLSYSVWQQTFAGDPHVVGTTVRLNGTPTTIVGVMPAGFRYPLTATDAIYRPFHLQASLLNGRGSHFLPTIARLKPGITPAQAQADMNHTLDGLRSLSDDDKSRVANLLPLSEATLGKTAGPLRVLTGAVLGVLLIGCFNVAGLLLARGVRRQREFALRVAIGAGQSRIRRQLLTEAALLSLAGAAVGALLAVVLLQLIRQLLVHSLARGADVTLNLPVLAATVVIALATGLLAGLIPAIQSARIAPSLALRSGGSAGTSRGQSNLRSTLIAGQVAIALALLALSGILLRNLHNLRSTALGFDPSHLLTEELFVTPANYTGRDMVTSFYNPLLERVRAIPGVRAASVIDLLPIADYGNNSDISIVGKPAPPPDQASLAENRVLLPGAMEALGAHLVRGRALSAALDHAGAPLDANVNEAFVRKFFSPGEDPVGRQFTWSSMKVNIVGVTSDVRQNLFEPTLAEMDLSGSQVPAEYAVQALSHMTLVVNTGSLPPASLAPQLRAAMHSVDPGIPFREPLTMDQVVAEQLTFQRLESWLFGIFAALALTLSLVGIYGMVQHEVELRTRDIGVRMALGSTRGRVVAGILQRIAALMLAGVGVGWVLTFSLKRVLSSTLELHSTSNLGLFLALTVGLALFGIAASLLPARRAASIQPTEALRTE